MILCGAIACVFIVTTCLSAAVYSENLNHDSENSLLPDKGPTFRGKFALPQAEFPDQFNLDVFVDKDVGNLSHFWESTGFCPPEPHQAACQWFLSDDMRQNLAIIGALPHSGIKQVRIHYLLNAVTVSGFKDGKPLYNTSCLEDLVQLLWENGLKPGFEIMGNPSNMFTDMENKTQVYWWKDMMSQIAELFKDEYGAAYVNQWNFESWNEPKITHFDSPLHFSVQGFLNYYDACSEGLKAASLSLRLGAPGGACKGSDHSSLYCWSLLRHIQNGTNYFTGKTGGRVDFLSMHRKGDEMDNSFTLITKELDFIDRVKQDLPKLVDVPLYNDEADPLVGWSKPRWWRADATYAATAAKVIALHQNMWIQPGKVDYRLLSNDNGFLSYQPHQFTQRTLVARFQVNDTEPHYTQMIRKPIYSLMGLLSLLGDKQLQVNVNGGAGALNDTVGTIASVHHPDPSSSQDSFQMGMVVYSSSDTHPNPPPAAVHACISGLPDNLTDPMYTLYILDNTHGNPYLVYKNAGSPSRPKDKLFQNMRDNEEPVRLEGPAPLKLTSISKGGGYVRYDWTLNSPAVILLHFCDKPQLPPDQITNLVLRNITHNQVLITWSDHCLNSKCLKTIELEFSALSEKGPYSRINKKDTIFNSFVFAPGVQQHVIKGRNSDETVRGWYRARAVDYWGRPGTYSLAAYYS